MLKHYRASRSCIAGQLRLCFLATLGLIFANSFAIASAQNFSSGFPQQNAIPVMQQNGEVITQYYYPVAPERYYIAPPQQNAYPPPPQIGFPTPQPRFLPSGPLYIDPTPTPPPQSNIYGEVIVGKFVEDPASPLKEIQTNPSVQNVADQSSTNQLKPSTAKSETVQSDADAGAQEKPGTVDGQGDTKGDGKQASIPQKKEPPVTQDTDLAATKKKEADAAQNAKPKVEQAVTEDPSETQSGSQTKQPVGQSAKELEQMNAGVRRSDSFMDPLGPIAEDQKEHLFWVTVLTLVAVLPVFILLPLILFRNRRGRKNKESYQPKWDSSTPLELLMWGVPVVLVTFMSARLWHSTHTLDPYAEIFSRNTTVNVQVVGLDWKWLFIYPDHGIATVGEFAIPIDHPASLTLTTDTVMQSFVIPALGGQIYAMPGMQTKLNLIADQLGSMEGENTQFNGDGFAGQKFMTHVVPTEEFEAWVETVKQHGVPLDGASYKILARRTDQSKAIADLRADGMPAGAIYFTVDDEDFFDNIMMRYMNHKPLKDKDQPGSPTYGTPDETTETSSGAVGNVGSAGFSRQVRNFRLKAGLQTSEPNYELVLGTGDDQ